MASPDSLSHDKRNATKRGFDYQSALRVVRGGERLPLWTDRPGRLVWPPPGDPVESEIDELLSNHDAIELLMGSANEERQPK